MNDGPIFICSRQVHLLDLGLGIGIFYFKFIDLAQDCRFIVIETINLSLQGRDFIFIIFYL